MKKVLQLMQIQNSSEEILYGSICVRQIKMNESKRFFFSLLLWHYQFKYFFLLFCFIHSFKLIKDFWCDLEHISNDDTFFLKQKNLHLLNDFLWNRFIFIFVIFIRYFFPRKNNIKLINKQTSKKRGENTINWSNHNFFHLVTLEYIL